MNEYFYKRQFKEDRYTENQLWLSGLDKYDHLGQTGQDFSK